ncbi:MAG: hypothetical protein JSR63_07965 [Proteobacteria bacterium]|nr:hypothetical protein [Pseudomonadota bacterium]
MIDIAANDDPVCRFCDAPLQHGYCTLGCSADKPGPAIMQPFPPQPSATVTQLKPKTDTAKYAAGIELEYEDLKPSERAHFDERFGTP